MMTSCHSRRMHLLALGCCLLFLMAAPASGSVPGFLRVQGTTLVDSTGSEVILRGFGLGGWLVMEGYQAHIPGFGSPSDIEAKIFDLIGDEAAEAFYRGWIQNYATEEEFGRMASWGLNSVRLPFHYRMFEPEGQAGIRPEDPFAFLDRIVGWCRNSGLYLILDMHCAPGGQNHGNISDSNGTARLWLDAANRKRTVEIWKSIAAHFRDEPVIAGYDLINEPVLPSGHTSAELRALYVTIRDSIRAVDANHILFIEGNWYASDFTGLTPAFDDNMVYAFHRYWDAVTPASVRKYTSLRATAKRPVWLGETGENSNAWFTACVRLMEKNGIGWNWWTHKKVATTTSPFSAPLPDECQRVFNFWGGTAPEPAADAAEAALLDLADGLRTERCAFLPDVVDALVRQPSDPSAKPYAEHVLPGLIPAAEYDMGEPLVAYKDSVSLNQTGDAGGAAWNSGGAFRNDGVDLEPSGDGVTAFDVGWIDTGEWLQYTVEVATAGVYAVDFRVAALSAGGKLRLLMDGAQISATLNVPATGGWKNWRTISDTGLTLAAGTHTFRAEAVRGGFNLLSLEFRLVRPAAVGGRAPERTLPMAVETVRSDPAGGGFRVPFRLSAPGPVRAQVFDVSGRSVRVLRPGVFPAGRSTLEWDGLDGSGCPAASGLYLIRIRAAGRAVTVKLTIQR
ncbi:MAG: cellulase family glycosylhydrolase [bacterium]|nr:cellulase family glycosylhydrolase [bacterium]